MCVVFSKHVFCLNVFLFVRTYIHMCSAYMYVYVYICIYHLFSWSAVFRSHPCIIVGFWSRCSTTWCVPSVPQGQHPGCLYPTCSRSFSFSLILPIKEPKHLFAAHFSFLLDCETVKTNCSLLPKQWPSSTFTVNLELLASWQLNTTAQPEPALAMVPRRVTALTSTPQLTLSYLVKIYDLPGKFLLGKGKMKNLKYFLNNLH